jgi:hypothetical protein
VEELSAGVRGWYADAERRLLDSSTRQLVAGYEAPGWATTELADTQPLRRTAQQIVDALGTAMGLEVHDAVTEAYNASSRAGPAELGALHGADARRIAESTPNARAVDRLAHEAVERVTATRNPEGVADGYRQTVAEVSGTPLPGVEKRRQATQAAMQRFAGRGRRTFVDRSGRSWSMTSYAGMAVRTAVGRAAVEAPGDRPRAAGISLVIASNAPHGCPLGKPYEGKVPALDGPGGARTIEVEPAAEDGRTVRAQVPDPSTKRAGTGSHIPTAGTAPASACPRRPERRSNIPQPPRATTTQRQRAIERPPPSRAPAPTGC